jgi:DNA-binding MarR family transcriptional regulator
MCPHSFPPPSEQDAPKALHFFMCAFMHRSVEQMTSALQELDLSMPQMGTLHFLNAEGAKSVSAIAQHLGLSLAATSHLIERLVQRELVSRSEDPSDRRHKRVALAEEGRQLINNINEHTSASLEEMLCHVPEELRERFDSVMEDLVDALNIRGTDKV